MDKKFNEVANDILDKIFNMRYDDKDKEIIRLNIMMNFYQMTRSDIEYEKNVKVLKRINNQEKNI